MTSMLIVAGVGFLLVLGAWGLWALVRSWDRTNAIVAAAPELPLRMVNVWDPVWLRGDIDCPDPVHVPHFERPALHYDYKLEKYVTRTRRTSDGKEETYQEWETVETRSDFAWFSVRQGNDHVAVAADKAKWQYEASDSETLGIWRHSCSYTPCPGAISVIGVIGEKKTTIEPLMHVPLIVTPRERQSYLASAESAERWAGFAGYIVMLLGFGGLGFGLLRYLQTRDMPAQPHWWDTQTGMVALACGVGAITLFWLVRTYNTLIIFHTRAEQSWSGIDVQLKQRYDLIPNLVEVVKGYMAHEKGTLERLTRLRTEALADRIARIKAEKDVVEDMGRIAMVAERFPDLKANDQFKTLARQLTALEDKIAHARRFFNDSVAEYNRGIAIFPNSVVAGVCGFKSYPLFAADVTERAAVRFEFA
ncbi:MAG: LemA family protein [Gemmataceae bacterium]